MPILIVGTLSDIFDGILARRFGVATPALRRFDSIADIVYYLFILGATWVLCKDVIQRRWPFIVLILVSEAIAILVCFAKFRTYPATHSYLAKFYGLCLLAGLILLMVFNAGDLIVITLAIVAVLANAEIIAIHLLADRPPVDVKSVFAIPAKYQSR